MLSCKLHFRSAEWNGGVMMRHLIEVARFVHCSLMPHNGNGMEFLTLHQLSRELNKPERVLRHRFKNLLKKNTLVEGEDFIREGYIDDQHFVFKINPVRFAQLTELAAAPPPDSK